VVVVVELAAGVQGTVVVVDPDPAPGVVEVEERPPGVVVVVELGGQGADPEPVEDGAASLVAPSGAPAR